MNPSVEDGPDTGSRRATPALRAWHAAAAGGLLALVVTYALGDAADGAADALYYCLELLAAVACVARAVRVRDERAAWALLAAGIVSFTVGDALWDVAYGGTAPG